MAKRSVHRIGAHVLDHKITQYESLLLARQYEAIFAVPAFLSFTLNFTQEEGVLLKTWQICRKTSRRYTGCLPFIPNLECRPYLFKSRKRTTSIKQANPAKPTAMEIYWQKGERRQKKCTQIIRDAQDFFLFFFLQWLTSAGIKFGNLGSSGPLWSRLGYFYSYTPDFHCEYYSSVPIRKPNLK